ncbi:galactokinase [Alteromonadaceae bacterium Bs31]|nr:galactokinase [Alteromonadaceae bacterium Bs31]
MQDPKRLAANGHEQYFAKTADKIFTAPGRVNLIGEHTDYNDGFVLPVAINFYTAIAASKRDDRRIEAIALDEAAGKVSFCLDEKMQLDNEQPWSNYLRGVIAEMQSAGLLLTGANMVISGNVPLGAGLSSSAALENVSAAALTGLSGEALGGRQAALFGQAAENNFVGCNCGIMDQLVSALGESGKAMLLDCRSLETRMVAMPADCSLIIVNSNVKRGLVGSEYNLRRQQCEQVAAHFKVKALRDLSLQQLRAEQAQIDPVAYRRALHVISENQRTLAATEALSRGDLTLMGELMAASHSSMKDDFEITVPAIDTLVSIIAEVLKGRGGVRMTGGGFGGCVVALVATELEQQVLHAVEQKYYQQSGLKADIYVCQASAGAFSSS